MLLKQISNSSLIKICATISSMLISVVIARSIGSEALGVVNLSNRIVNILLIFGSLGVKQIAMRDLSISLQNSDISGFKRQSNEILLYILRNGLILFVGVLIVAPIVLTGFFSRSDLLFPLLIIFASFIPQLITRVYAWVLLGMKLIVRANLIENAASIFLTLLSFLVCLLFHIELTIIDACFVFLSSRVLCFIIVVIFWKRDIGNPFANKRGESNIKDKSTLFYQTDIISSLITMSDVVLVGIFFKTEIVAYYSVASSLTMVTSFFLKVVSTAAAARISQSFYKKDFLEMQSIVNSSKRMLGLLGITQFIFLILFGGYILKIWGNNYDDYYNVLIILAFGQLVNNLTGMSSVLLAMCGLERLQRSILLKVLILYVPMVSLFSIYIGPTGTAVAYVLTILLLSLYKVWAVKTKIGIKII